MSCKRAPDKHTQTQVKAIGSVVCADVSSTYYREFLASLTAHKQSTLFPLILSVPLANTTFRIIAAVYSIRAPPLFCKWPLIERNYVQAKVGRLFHQLAPDLPLQWSSFVLVVKTRFIPLPSVQQTGAIFSRFLGTEGGNFRSF